MNILYIVYSERPMINCTMKFLTVVLTHSHPISQWLILTISVSGAHPTLPELLELNIPFHVADNYELFGTFLLQDDTGHKVDIIEHNRRGDAEGITTAILKKWLQGGGMSVTWESLIEALKKCKASYLANQLDAATKQL